MGNLLVSQSEEIINAIKSDNDAKLKEYYEQYNIETNREITQGRSAIVLCAIYGSEKCIRFLIEKGNDVNQEDKSDGSSPLIISAKFNYINIIELLLSNNANVNIKNVHDLTALDMAIIRGNYETALYLYTKTNLKIEKSLEQYIELNKQLVCPLFNIELFYNCLMNKMSIDKVPSFANVSGTKRKQFDGKVPDPNESWGDFIKRLGRLELYQPPLVDGDKVEKKNSFYMRMQSKLVEMEYGVKIDLKGKKEDIEKNEGNDKIKVVVKNDEERRLTHQLVGDMSGRDSKITEGRVKTGNKDMVIETVKKEINETEENVRVEPKTEKNVIEVPTTLIMKENLSA